MPFRLVQSVILAAVALSGVAAETRYLANAGDDAADGRTPATAWRTIGRLNAGLPAGGRGLLRRGDVFHGTIRVKGGPDAAHSTAITAYGEGAKPVITTAVRVPTGTNVWALVGRNIWKTPLEPSIPGVLIVDGELKAELRYDYNDVNRMWDFAGQDGWLYVHATNNPSLLAKEIRVTVKEDGAVLASNTELRGLCFREIGAHGAYAGWHNELVSHLRVVDCDFDTIGGSELVGYAQQAHVKTPVRVRYGNGVEFGHNVSDAIVEGCTFRGVYDTGTTMQGLPQYSWKDIHIRKCRFEECTQAFEVWCRKAAAGCGFENCSFTDNVCVRVGCGWGAEVRPNRACAAPLLMYAMEVGRMDILVARNQFIDFPGPLFYRSGGNPNPPPGYRMEDNVSRRMGDRKDEDR